MHFYGATLSEMEIARPAEVGLEICEIPSALYHVVFLATYMIRVSQNMNAALSSTLD